MSSPVTDARFCLAARAYRVYGIVYWLGGLALAAGGRGPRGLERGGVAWFVVGALFIVVVPWLLTRERRWFARWLLARRDFARVLTVLVAWRAWEVGRLAQAGGGDVPVLGVPVPFALGAWAFCALTVVTAVLLARAAWAPEP